MPQCLKYSHSETGMAQADLVTLRICIYDKFNYPLSANDMTLSSNNKRSGKVRIEQSEHTLRTSNSLFAHHAVKE